MGGVVGNHTFAASAQALGGIGDEEITAVYASQQRLRCQLIHLLQTGQRLQNHN
jgi:hypothetical protein